MASAVPAGPVRDILDKLDKVKRNGSGWIARCPAHDDKNPSLSISEGNDGRAMLNCHAGCTIEAICASIGVTVADLFPPRGSNGSAKTIVATYDYVDENGDLLYQAVRYQPKDFRQRRPNGNGGWEWTLGSTRRVLYRLPAIRQAITDGATIYICEGEKDVHAIERAGAVATTNAMGAKSWRDEYADQLAGAHNVVIVADNDDAGRAHAATVAASLQKRNIATSTVTAATGKDAYDHLAAGKTVHEFVPADTHAAPGSDENVSESVSVRVVPLEQFVSVEEEASEPLVGAPDDTILPADGLLLMYGDGGAGKTTLSIDAVAHLASGVPWIGLDVPRRLRVLLIENEGPRGPFRLRLANKIKGWDRTPFAPNVCVLEEPWTRFTLEDDDYRAQLAAEIDRTDSDIVVVGPLASLGAKGTGTPDDVNDFDKLINDLRARTKRRFALWIVHHENKSGDVSGAWSRYPDTLVHIQAQGNGRTRIVWKKARWSSALHGTSVNLLWTDGNGFELEVKPSRDITGEIIDYLRGRDWHTIKEIADATHLGADTIRPIIQRLSDPDNRTLEHTTGRGVPGRNVNAKLYRISGDLGVPSHLKSPTLPTGAEEGADLPTRPISESGRSQVTSGTHSGDLTSPSHPVTSDDDPHIAYLEELARTYANGETE